MDQALTATSWTARAQRLLYSALCNPARQLLQVLLELIESTYCNLFIGH